MWSGVRAQGASKQAWAGFEQFLAGRKRERCSVQIRSKDAEGRVRAPCTGGPLTRPVPQGDAKSIGPTRRPTRLTQRLSAGSQRVNRYNTKSRLLHPRPLPVKHPYRATWDTARDGKPVRRDTALGGIYLSLLAALSPAAAD